ncbi:hypothetical protein BVG16_20255 [Paenibacillus selenitireducens]|uniref:Uncharacterized protein n=1 Tax=Paenibacillus selenitireducens TaxID=1324314 RepID=A0A1T2X714_9BACL|nr:hypothetical protein BVG16_20255 [Paenibacillus selenitireducens]
MIVLAMLRVVLNLCFEKMDHTFENPLLVVDESVGYTLDKPPFLEPVKHKAWPANAKNSSL